MSSQKTGTVYTGIDVSRRIIAGASVNGIGYTQLCLVAGASVNGIGYNTQLCLVAGAFCEWHWLHPALPPFWSGVVAKTRAGSLELLNFRCTHLLGDGDAEAHAAVNEDAPYGDCSIERIECVNHVTKRMGTALRTLVEKQKSTKRPIGGREKPTEARVKQLTNYYGRAIKDNSGDLNTMQCGHPSSTH
ncbi:hypothetical protein ACOMHN_038765 [Nucella lapillus]